MATFYVTAAAARDDVVRVDAETADEAARLVAVSWNVSAAVFAVVDTANILYKSVEAGVPPITVTTVDPPAEV